METILIILSVLFVVVPLVAIARLEKGPSKWYLISFVSLLFALMTISLAMSITVSKSLLDKPNPYHKEYVYHQKPDGEMVKVDSIYVKTKKQK